MSNLVADPPAPPGSTRPPRAVARDVIAGLACLASAALIGVLAVHQSLYDAVVAVPYSGDTNGMALVPFLGWTAGTLWVAGTFVVLRAVHELALARDEAVVPAPVGPVEPARVVLPESLGD